MAGPLDELVKRILRRIDVFKTDNGLEEVEVTVELLDGSLHRLRTLSADPGYGFVSFRPHGGEDEPEELIVRAPSGVCPAVGGDQAAGFRSCGNPAREQGRAQSLRN
jgi:hypothetical protein